MFNSVNSLITNFSFSQSQPPQSTSTEYIQRINNPKQHINPPSDKSISDLQTKKKIHECTVCHISFTRKNNLTAHTKESHTNKGKKLNECAVCHKSFTRKNNLIAHTKVIHTNKGKKLHECAVCHKSFTRKNNLIAHTKVIHTNTGKKPHECIFCDSAFIQKSDLTRHLRIHTGERPYKCTVCPKAFALLGTLKTHVLIHTRIKPHKCKVCPKAFIQKHHLKKHEKAKHANRNIISNHLQQDNLTIEKQIEEVINSCHSEKKITALNDIYEIISLACMKRRISIEKTLLDIFNALSKKHISKNDADSIASKLRVVFKKLPEKIKFENTSFLKNICNDETGYINSLLKLKERDVDEIIQEAFKAEYAVAKHDAIRDVNYSQAIELDDTTAPTREKPANNKRPPDNDYDTLNYKKPRNN